MKQRSNARRKLVTREGDSPRLYFCSDDMLVCRGKWLPRERNAGVRAKRMKHLDKRSSRFLQAEA